MRIVYVAKHDSGGADDEGAITHALTKLGHDVQRIREVNALKAYKIGGDLLLFHKWCNPQVLKQFEGKMPRVFWYFDLVYAPDPILRRRCEQRMAWMYEVMPHVELGFCTDGDWVDRDTGNKLVWLPQGADERIVGTGDPTKCLDPKGETWQLLFTGGAMGGAVRQSWVEGVKLKYSSFKHVVQGTYREDLRDLIACSEIVLCPDGPVTDKYWSNRVYNAVGFGGFVLHPYCERLMHQYGNRIEYYYDRKMMHTKIQWYLAHQPAREKMVREAFNWTLERHLYRHRCEALLATVWERLGVR